MKKQKISNNTFQLIVFIIIVFIINLFSMKIFHRFDFTKNKIYTLSPASKKAVDNLQDRVVVKAYFSKNLPGQLSETKRFTEDILSEYEACSKGKFIYEFINPEDNQELQEEAKINKIPPMNVQVTSKGKVEVREVYLGLSFMYQGEQETIPVVKTTRGLEYDITTMLKRLSSQSKPKVALYIEPNSFVTLNQGGQDSYQILRQALQRDNDLVEVNLMNPIENDINTLVFAGVKDSLGTDVLYNLDQFIMKGGNLLIFQDAVDVDLQSQKAGKIESDIFPFLYNYGIRTRNNLVKDDNCGSLTVTKRQGMFAIPINIKYPYFPLINNMNKDNLIVKNLENIQFIFASEIDSTFVKSGITKTPLISSSKYSTASYGPDYKIDYKLYMNKTDFKNDFKIPHRILAQLYEGNFESYYKTQVFSRKEKKVINRENGKIIMVTDGDFIRDDAAMGMNRGNNSNVDFVLNAVDYLSNNSLLIELRNRETTYKPLKDLSPNMRQFVKYINLFLPSIILIGIGIFYYRSQLMKRKMLRLKYEK